MKVLVMYKIAKKIPIDVDVEKTKDDGIKTEVTHAITGDGKGVEHKKVKISPDELKAKKTKHVVKKTPNTHVEVSESSSSFVEEK